MKLIHINCKGKSHWFGSGWLIKNVASSSVWASSASCFPPGCSWWASQLCWASLEGTSLAPAAELKTTQPFIQLQQLSGRWNRTHWHDGNSHGNASLHARDTEGGGNMPSNIQRNIIKVRLAEEPEMSSSACLSNNQSTNLTDELSMFSCTCTLISHYYSNNIKD